ncbi:MAG: endonuclease/exonuclease/phosphatase family protein [Bacteroidota bacterium]
MIKYLLPLILFTFLFNACSWKSVSSLETNNNLTTNGSAPEDFKKGIATPIDYQDITGDTIKILSWNVEHFIDDYDNPYTQNEREDLCDGMEDRVSLLIKALRIADADIVVLQEFEHVQFLRQIALDSIPDMGYRFFADNESIGWYMNVVVMSRVPLGIIYGYGALHTPAEYVDELTGRKVYETQSMINTRMWSIDVLVNDEYSFLLSAVHLKAGPGARNEAMRLGQIQFLKGQYERFLKENTNKNILVVGDFNATPDSKEMQYMLDGNSPARFVDNLDDHIFTHPADSLKWRIDYILPNYNMQAELVEHSLQVKYFFDMETQNKLADHLPLVAEFVTKDIVVKDSLTEMNRLMSKKKFRNKRLH